MDVNAVGTPGGSVRVHLTTIFGRDASGRPRRPRLPIPPAPSVPLHVFPPGQLVRRSGHWWWSSMTELGFVAEQRGPGTPHLVGCEPGAACMLDGEAHLIQQPSACTAGRPSTVRSGALRSSQLQSTTASRGCWCGGAPRSPRPWSGAGRAGQRREHPDLPRHSRGGPAPFPRGLRNHLELTRTTLFRSGAIALNYRPVSTEASTLHIES
jgi:hypothetical protein